MTSCPGGHDIAYDILYDILYDKSYDTVKFLSSHPDPDLSSDRRRVSESDGWRNGRPQRDVASRDALGARLGAGWGSRPCFGTVAFLFGL